MQTDGMASITVRHVPDVPDEVRDELAARARLSGRSLQEYVKMRLVGLASSPDPEVLIEQARERTKRTGSRFSAQRILAHRDRDRRRPWSLPRQCWLRRSSTVVRTVSGPPPCSATTSICASSRGHTRRWLNAVDRFERS
jgi:antitoxin FitA